jgi:hypothetical protein
MPPELHIREVAFDQRHQLVEVFVEVQLLGLGDACRATGDDEIGDGVSGRGMEGNAGLVHPSIIPSSYESFFSMYVSRSTQRFE